MPGDSTFEQLWNRLILRAPDLPLPLAQEFVNTSYSRILSNLGWSGLKGYGEIYLPVVYSTGTADVTNNSTTVTGTTTVWTTAMIGRQFNTNGMGPFYTITAVDAGAQTLTLDRVWGGSTATGQTYTIQLVYPVMPTDFLNFETIVDITNRWRLWHVLPQSWIDTVDAARTYVGTPSWVFAYASPSPVTSTLNQVRYEVWPRGTTEKTYPYTYTKRLPLLDAPTDRPIFPVRGDLIMEGAMAELTLLKQIGKNQNPWFDPSAHRLHEARFLQRLEQVKNDDEGINQTRVFYDEDKRGWPMAPIDSKFIQTHLLP